MENHGFVLFAICAVHVFISCLPCKSFCVRWRLSGYRVGGGVGVLVVQTRLLTLGRPIKRSTEYSAPKRRPVLCDLCARCRHVVAANHWPVLPGGRGRTETDAGRNVSIWRTTLESCVQNRSLSGRKWTVKSFWTRSVVTSQIGLTVCFCRKRLKTAGSRIFFCCFVNVLRGLWTTFSTVWKPERVGQVHPLKCFSADKSVCWFSEESSLTTFA